MTSIPTFTQFFEAREGQPWPMIGEDLNMRYGVDGFGGYAAFQARVLEAVRDYLDQYGPAGAQPVDKLP